MILETMKLLIQSMQYLIGALKSNSFKSPLSKEEEACHLTLLAQGNKESRDILIEHNLRLVVHIVKKFDTRYENTEDLISIGTIGLIKGIDSYDLTKGRKLTTYVSRCIENEILMYLRSNKKNRGNISLDTMIVKEDQNNHLSLLDVLADEQVDVVAEMDKEEKLKQLRDYLKELPPREYAILQQRYGLQNQTEKTQKEIAKEQHISRSYVSRLEKRAFTHLLKQFRKKENDEL